MSNVRKQKKQADIQDRPTDAGNKIIEKLFADRVEITKNFAHTNFIYNPSFNYFRLNTFEIMYGFFNKVFVVV